MGDLNSDGHVNNLDADIILQAVFGDISETPQMDVNQDGNVDVRDAQWILDHVY